MRVALVVDNPFRDLPGTVLLATRLVQRGVTVHLVPMYCLGELIQLAPDFVLLNYLRRNNEEVAAQLAECGVPLGIHDTEGGIIARTRTHSGLLARDAELRHQVAVWCSWGRRQAELAVQHDWFREHQIEVTGACRFDFYSRQLQPAATAFANHAARYPQPLVLFNGTFTLCNPGFQTADEEVAMLVERFGHEREQVLAMQQAQATAMEGMVALANRFAARFPHVTFVFRPHPFEALSTYSELLTPRGNLHVVKEGTVDSWILRSAAVIQHNCTTGIEAGLAGVPTLLPAWLPPMVEMPEVEAVSAMCASGDEMEECLATILRGDYVPPAAVQAGIDRVMDNWFCSSDGKAHERVGDAILRLLSSQGSSSRMRCCRRIAFGLDRTDRTRGAMAHAGLSALLGLPLHWSFRRWRPEPVFGDFSWWLSSEKYFGPQEVRAIWDAIVPCLSDSRGIPVEIRQDPRDYPFGYVDGQSTTLVPR